MQPNRPPVRPPHPPPAAQPQPPPLRPCRRLRRLRQRRSEAAHLQPLPQLLLRRSLSEAAQQRDIDQCAAIRSLPPLSIADEDRITKEEVELHSMRLQQRMMSLLPSDPFDDGYRACMADLKPVRCTDLARLYPPHPSLPWWSSASAICAEFHASMYVCAATMHVAICTTNVAYDYAAIEYRHTLLSPFAKQDTLVYDEFFPPLPPSLDESRLFHRLLRYLIYYFRHVDPSLIHPQLRPSSTCVRTTTVS